MSLLAPVTEFAHGVTAVTSRELRGRMRGRRAFVVLTVYLVLLAAIAFGIYAYLQRQADLDAALRFRNEEDVFGSLGGVSPGFALSARVGHMLFSGILLLETLLVLVLAPAFTAGAISSEREHQTLDLLVTTPLSTLGVVVGKLVSALAWVLVLIVASVPLMSLVFVFGSVGPEDVLRAYVLLFTLAFGMGAVGLFLSALVRRTQAATVLASIVVLVVALGSIPVHALWSVLGTTATRAQNGLATIRQPNRGPDALLWLNPLVGAMDLICTTAPGGYERFTCDYVAAVTHTPFFGGTGQGDETGRDGPLVDFAFANGIAWRGDAVQVMVIDKPFVGDVEAVQATSSFGFPRDTFWPRNAASFVILGIVLTLLSTQLVAPTRRLRLRRRGRGTRTPPVIPDASPEATP
jgi:ABC-type transport system involved in multi-copper enzyme maturation permease subunit